MIAAYWKMYVNGVWFRNLSPTEYMDVHKRGLDKDTLYKFVEVRT